MVNQIPCLFVLLEQDGPFEEWPIEESSTPTPPIKIQVLGQAIDLGTLELNTMVKDLRHITMDFVVLPMYEVHAIQNAVVAKMKNRDYALVKQIEILTQKG